MTAGQGISSDSILFHNVEGPKNLMVVFFRGSSKATGNEVYGLLIFFC